ncbi:MAG TPA: isochorismatase family cysteine hydrolase [Roseiflexaceae bacterium]|nr:isochorismatase family cysteine hydrolase [Roseiflexaceae bacterium]
MVDFAVIPARTALINVDMQNCFVAGYPMSAPDGLALLERINQLAAACRAAGILVVHTRHVLRPDGANVGVFGEIVPPAKDGFFRSDSVAVALHPRLAVDAQDIVLDKPRYGAFHATDLEMVLRAWDIDTLIISGIATNVCCETTAREAMVRDFHVLFLSDGTATLGMGDASADELQKATLATLGTLFAQVLSIEEMLHKISGAEGVVKR